MIDNDLPWRVEDEDPQRPPRVLGLSGRDVATVYGESQIERAARARLIAECGSKAVRQQDHDEVLLDLALETGYRLAKRKMSSADSRQLVNRLREAAGQFETLHENTDWHNTIYMEEIDKFTNQTFEQLWKEGIIKYDS